MDPEAVKIKIFAGELVVCSLQYIFKNFLLSISGEVVVEMAPERILVALLNFDTVFVDKGICSASDDEFMAWTLICGLEMTFGGFFIISIFITIIFIFWSWDTDILGHGIRMCCVLCTVRPEITLE